jgi:hypothetical protein
MTAIVKVQIPLATNDPGQTQKALVYAEGRRLVMQQKLDHATQSQMGNDLKAYFEAEYRHGRWAIGHRVTDREW